jgi:hypothetical protein
MRAIFLGKSALAEICLLIGNGQCHPLTTFEVASKISGFDRNFQSISNILHEIANLENSIFRREINAQKEASN